jgi:multiple sugar transport system substrate-binding protein
MYNKAKLDEAGISAPPRTWRELKDQSRLLMSKGLVRYGYTDSYAQQQTGANEILFAVYGFKGDFFDKDLNLSVLTSPGLKEAYQYLYDGLQVSKFIDPASLPASYENAADTFCMGNTAFMLQAWPGVYDQANDASMSRIVGQIEVAPYSLSVDGSSQVVLTLPEAMAIPKTSKNKDAAWKYIEYFSSKEFDKEKALAIGALPIWTDNFTDPELLAQYPYWQQFGQQAQHARGFADIEWFDEFSSVLQIESQRILLGNVPVDRGLTELNAQLQAIPKN